MRHLRVASCGSIARASRKRNFLPKEEAACKRRRPRSARETLGRLAPVIGVRDAVALVLEGRTVGALGSLPAGVLALVLVVGHGVGLEVVNRAVEVNQVGFDVVARVVRA